MPTGPEFLEDARILIVEDEALIAWELLDRLTRLGMTVVSVVDSAAAAVHTVARDRPHVVLMDIRLRGERDGIDAAQEIRRMDVPVVFLTAHSDKATLERAGQAGPFGYVLKPFKGPDLIAAIEGTIRRHSAERRPSPETGNT